MTSFYALACLLAVAPRTTVISHITVIDGTGRPPLQDQTVVVEGNRIARVASAAKVPAGATVIDGRGKFMIPGLWDMHTHLDDSELLELKPTKREKELQLPLFIANGVTGVRDMGSDLNLMKDWRQRISEKTLLGPRMYFAGPLVDGPVPMWPASVAVGTPEDGRRAVQELKRRGADFIKVYSLLPKDAYFAISEECLKEGITFAGHVPYKVTNLEAVNAGQKSLEHLLQLERELADPQQVDAARKQIPAGLTRPQQFKYMREAYDKCFSEEIARGFYKALKTHGTWITPTLLVMFEDSSYDPNDPIKTARLPYEPAYIRQWWDPSLNIHVKSTPQEIKDGQKITLRIYQRIVRGLRDAGVPMMVGSDMGGNPHCFAGWGVHDEMAMLVGAGLTPMEAIVAATSNPCKFMGVDDRLGTIAAGKMADLVILNRDPLADIRNTQSIDAVLYDGKLLNRRALDAMLRSAKQNGAKRHPLQGSDDMIENPAAIHFF
jgi:imidazolonepropionase-like amidohydrolase